MEILNSKYQDCIDFLNDCAQICNENIDASLSSSDYAKRRDLIKSLIECSSHCAMTVGFLARKSMHSEELAKISAHLAKVTAAECEKFEDEHTQLTKQVCLETADLVIASFDE